MKRLLRYVPFVYVAFLLPCLVYTVGYTAYHLKTDYVDIPTWDAWQCVADLDPLCRLDLRPLWRQHYEHRVIGVQLLYWVDLGALDGHQYLVIGCEIVCQLAQLSLIWWLLWQMAEIPRAFRLALAAICGILMTTAFHVQAMVIPYLVQWYLTQALELFALLFLWRAFETGRAANLIAVISSTVVVMYTTGNGLLLWPVLLLMAILLRMPRRHIAVLAAAAAISIAPYFVGYVFAGHGKTMVFVSHPLYAIRFAAILLGAPASYISNWFGCIVGLGGMAFTVVVLIVMLRRRKSLDVVCVVAAGYCLFTVVSAVMAAYGRMNVADPAFLKARAVRYVMISLAFWANLVVLIAWLMLRPRPRTQQAWHLAISALSLLLVVAVLSPQQNSERRGAARQALAAQGTISLETGVQDKEALGEVYQDANVLWELTPVLLRRCLAVFAAGRQDWIGHRVSDLFAAAAPDLCSGSTDPLRVVDNGFRAQGRAFDLRTNVPPEDIVLANSQGTIVGLGATRGPASDWVGFAQAAGLPGTLQAYAILPDQTACMLGVPVSVPVRQAEELSAVWLPDSAPPSCPNAQIQLHRHWIEVRPLNEDPQLLFDVGPALGGFRTLIVRAKFEKFDRIDAFFGKQVEGRGIYGSVPVTNQWVDVYLNVSHNPYWLAEHGRSLRFDPVSSAGPGTTAYIAGVWGSTQSAPSDWPDVQFYPVPAAEAPSP